MTILCAPGKQHQFITADRLYIVTDAHHWWMIDTKNDFVWNEITERWSPREISHHGYIQPSDYCDVLVELVGEEECSEVGRIIALDETQTKVFQDYIKSGLL